MGNCFICNHKIWFFQKACIEQHHKLQVHLKCKLTKSYVKGGNCGLCGKWISTMIVERDWKWGLCKDCDKEK